MTYPGAQPIKVVEKVGVNGVRVIEYDPNFPGFVLHRFSAVDGSLKKMFINLASCMFFDYEFEEVIEVDQNSSS